MFRAITWSIILIALTSLDDITRFIIAAEPTKPNVILFLVDDMGWMDSTPYGSKYYDTPNMQRLAERGMRFTQAYSQPLCSPTRASLMTGQYTSRHGITTASGHTPPHENRLVESAPANRPWLMPEGKTFLDLSQYTLAEALRDAGYHTGHFGKWHLGLTEPHWPEKQGFDVAFHAEPSPGPPGAYFSPYGVMPPGTAPPKAKGQKHVLGTITDGPPGEYITDRLTDEALKFIENNRSQPFFLNLWHYGVHGPWGHKEAITAEMAKRVDPTGRQDNPVMASMLKSVDESLGRILDKLDQLKLAENTVLIFTSDNGGNVHSNTEEDNKTQARAETPNSASYRKWAGFKPPTNNFPLRNGKGRLYEGGTRVPLIVHWPGKIKANTTSDAIVGCIDVYPTVLALTGIKPKAEQIIDGISYAPVLQSKGSITREAYFIWFPHLVPGVSVRQGDWKLIRRFEERPDEYEGTRELFNLREDLGETKNLAAAMPEKVKELDALIDAFVRDTKALYPKPNPAYKPRTVSSQPTTAAGSLEELSRGLVPKQCTAKLIEGGLQITADVNNSFLGSAAVKHTGSLKLKLRVRSTAGGLGKVQWLTTDQTDFPKNGQMVDFKLAASKDWQDVTVAVPLEGESRLVRIYLPAKEAPVDIESINWLASQSEKSIKAWNFRGAKP